MKLIRKLEATIDQVLRPALLKIEAKHVLYFCIVACCIALTGLL